MKRAFLFLSERLYRRWKPFIVKKKNQKVCKELQQLYPLENMEEMHDHFQVKKLAVVFMIIGIGIVSAVCLYLSSRMEGRLAEGMCLFRNEWDAGDYSVTLIAETEKWSRKIPFLVETRKLSEQETDILQKKLYTQLPEWIKGENADLDHVASNLHFPAFIDGYPFRLTWESSNKDRIDRNGKVNREGIDTEEKVELTVTIVYGQEKNSFIYEVSVLPEMPSEEERFFRRLEDLLFTIDQEGRELEQILLPDFFEGKAITWKEDKKNNTFLILILTVLGCVAAAKGMEKDLEKDCKKRNKQLLLDYPGFVSKLRLYMSAGLSAKNAFYRIMKDYESVQKQRKRYLYKEMKISCSQLGNGVMEEQVYREFGKRCGEMRYRRLSFLLAVHLKQGNGQLLALLSEEAEDALEDRKNMARKSGEEASTKLLLPMMLMLVVVMFLVLMPAYLNFGSGV